MILPPLGISVATITTRYIYSFSAASVTTCTIYNVIDLALHSGVLPTEGWLHTGRRLHIVGIIEKKLSKLVFTLYFQFYLPWSGLSIACIGTTNLAITLPFILDDNI